MDQAEVLHENSPPAAQRPKTVFASDVLKLVSGTSISQIIAVLASPILTRLYAPEAFGLAALFTSLVSVVSVIACMRYELSIVLPEDDDYAANLLGLSLSFSFLIALLLIPSVWFGGPIFLEFVGMPELTPYLWMIPLTVFVRGAFTALNYWNTRTKSFTELSIASASSTLSTNIAKIGAGFAGNATGGAMIVATVVGYLVGTGILGVQAGRDYGAFMKRSLDYNVMLQGLRRYKKFPLMDTWAGLLNMASVQLPTLILGAFFSPVIVGFYALGYRLLSLPMSLLGAAVGKVFLQRAAVAKNESSLPDVVQNVFRRLLNISTFPFILLMIIGPDAFSLVFGEEWHEAGIYVQLLAPWLLLVFVGSPLSTLVYVLDKQSLNLLFNFSLIVSRAASLVIGGIMNNVTLALSLFSVSGTILWVWFCLYIVAGAGVPARHIVHSIASALLSSGLFIIPVLILEFIVDAPPLVTVTVGVTSTLGYYLSMLSFDRQLRSIVVTTVTNGFRK